MKKIFIKSEKPKGFFHLYLRKLLTFYLVYILISYNSNIVSSLTI